MFGFLQLRWVEHISKQLATTEANRLLMDFYGRLGEVEKEQKW